MRIWVEINLKALRRNLERVRTWAGPRTGALVVIKSDAYGHGMVPAARALSGARGLVFFGIGRPEEAACLRRAGIRNPVVMLGPFLADEVKELFRHRITPAISDERSAALLDAEARRRGRRVVVHVKVDTGMGRIGIWHEETLRFLDRLRTRYTRLEIEGILTHFSEADSPRTGFTRTQANRFRNLLRLLEARGERPRFVHAANSAAVIRKTLPICNLVRPGLCVYGILPGSIRPARGLRLEPVLTWKSRVTLVRDVPAGRYVSYGRRYRTRRPTRIATVSAGYADGYPVSLSNKGEVLVRGRRAPVVGQVTMDQLLVDVGHVRGIRPGDTVVLIGKQGKEEIKVEKMSKKASLIPYELLCGIGKHIPRCCK